MYTACYDALGCMFFYVDANWRYLQMYICFLGWALHAYHTYMCMYMHDPHKFLCTRVCIYMYIHIDMHVCLFFARVFANVALIPMCMYLACTHAQIRAKKAWRIGVHARIQIQPLRSLGRGSTSGIRWRLPMAFRIGCSKWTIFDSKFFRSTVRSCLAMQLERMSSLV